MLKLKTHSGFHDLFLKQRYIKREKKSKRRKKEKNIRKT